MSGVHLEVIRKYCEKFLLCMQTTEFVSVHIPVLSLAEKHLETLIEDIMLNLIFYKAHGVS